MQAMNAATLCINRHGERKIYQYKRINGPHAQACEGDEFGRTNRLREPIRRTPGRAQIHALMPLN